MGVTIGKPQPESDPSHPGDGPIASNLRHELMRRLPNPDVTLILADIQQRYKLTQRDMYSIAVHISSEGRKQR